VAEVLHEPEAALVVTAAVMLTAVPRAARAVIQVMAVEEPLTVAVLMAMRALAVLAAAVLPAVLTEHKVVAVV
jgi:hypothetical protein